MTGLVPAIYIECLLTGIASFASSRASGDGRVKPRVKPWVKPGHDGGESRYLRRLVLRPKLLGDLDRVQGCALQQLIACHEQGQRTARRIACVDPDAAHQH